MCPGKIPEAAACLPTVITCRLAGRDKNPPIAINHGELEKTARGNAHCVHVCSSSPSFSLSLSLPDSSDLSYARVIFPVAASHRASVFCLSNSVVTGSAAGISPLSPLNAIPYDRDKTLESHLKLVIAVPYDYRTYRDSDRKHWPRCEAQSPSSTFGCERKRERKGNLLYSDVVSWGRK